MQYLIHTKCTIISLKNEIDGTFIESGYSKVICVIINKSIS